MSATSTSTSTSSSTSTSPSNKLRIPTSADPTLPSPCTLTLITQEIAKVSKELGPLYPRAWSNFPTTTPTDESSPFTIMQFNMLAQGLSTGPPTIATAFPVVGHGGGQDQAGKTMVVKSNLNDFGGFDQIPNPEITLDWNRRKWRIVEEILRASPDILAIEEMDHYFDFFEPVMKSLGYSSLFQPKLWSPCLRHGWYSDGLALFWRDSAFTLQRDESGRFAEPNTSWEPSRPYLLVQLRSSSSQTQQKEVWIAVVHLKAKDDQVCEENRLFCVKQLLMQMQKIAFSSASAEGAAAVPMILLGDFNADCHDTSAVSAHCVPIVFAWNLPKLTSAYAVPKSFAEGIYTTWKLRGTYESKHVIDYIFYTSSSLQSVGTLTIPAESELVSSRLPGKEYPSDHFAIACKLRFASSSVQ